MKRILFAIAVLLSAPYLVAQKTSFENVSIELNKDEIALVRSSLSTSPYVLLGQTEFDLFRALESKKEKIDSQALHVCIERATNNIRLFPQDVLRQAVEDFILMLHVPSARTNNEMKWLRDKTFEELRSLFTQLSRFEVKNEAGESAGVLLVCRGKDNEYVNKTALPPLHGRAVHDVLVAIALPNGKHTIIGDLIVEGDLSVGGALTVIREIITTIITATNTQGPENIIISDDFTFPAGQQMTAPNLAVAGEHFQGDATLGNVSNANPKTVTFCFDSTPLTGAYIKVMVLAKQVGTNKSIFHTADYYFRSDTAGITTSNDTSFAPGLFPWILTPANSLAGPAKASITFTPNVADPTWEDAIVSWKLIAKNFSSPDTNVVVS